MLFETSKAQLNEGSKDLHDFLESEENISDLLFEKTNINSDLHIRIVDKDGTTVYQHKKWRI